MHWILLILSILAEIVGTLCLKWSEGFARLWPTVGMTVLYIATFVFLTYRGRPRAQSEGSRGISGHWWHTTLSRPKHVSIFHTGAGLGHHRGDGIAPRGVMRRLLVLRGRVRRAINFH